MNKSFAVTVIAVLSALIVFSCVSGKKFRELQNTSRQNMIDRDDFKAENLTLSMENREIEAKIAALEKDMSKSRQDLALAEIERNKAKEDLNIINERYNNLQNAQDDLIRGNVSETRKLLSDLQAAQDNLRQKEDIMRQLEQSMDLKKVSLDELTLELEKKNARLAELEKILDAQKKTGFRISRTRYQRRFLDLRITGSQLQTKTGKYMFRSMRNSFFKSASWDIDANGRNALKKLAGVLEKNPNIQVTIEGHTDNVPYNPGSGQLRDNWDLSVKRATTVVRVLLEGSKIKPGRLTASGRSEYFPVEAADTPDARQKNRRTEIILTPDLSELYTLINQY